MGGGGYPLYQAAFNLGYAKIFGMGLGEVVVGGGGWIFSGRTHLLIKAA